MKLGMSEGDRAYLTGQQALALDADGREILVGLTREESEWLLRDGNEWLDQRQSGTRSPSDKRRSVELHEKHEVARLQGIGLMSVKPHGTA